MLEQLWPWLPPRWPLWTLPMMPVLLLGTGPLVPESTSTSKNLYMLMGISFNDRDTWCEVKIVICYITWSSAAASLGWGRQECPGRRGSTRAGRGSETKLWGLRALTLYRSIWKYLHPGPTGWSHMLSIRPAYGNGLLVLILSHSHLTPFFTSLESHFTRIFVSLFPQHGLFLLASEWEVTLTSFPQKHSY